MASLMGNIRVGYEKVMSTSFLHIPVTVDIVDYEGTVLGILAEAIPSWDHKNIDIEKTTKGFANILFVCHDKRESDTSNNSTECDKIIVRVFGGNLGEMDRQSEIEIMKIVSENGIIPKVYCSFQNGVVYDYAPGIVPSKDQLLDQKILTLIALKLHAIHSLGAEKLSENLIKNTFVELFINQYWTILNSDNLKPDVEDSQFKYHFGSLEELEKLKSDATTIYEELVVRYPPVLCHMDTHNKNIVYDSKTDKITFVDWEICNIAPEVFDLAILVDRDNDFNDIDALDNPKARGQWVRTYLSTHPQYKSEPITNELFQQWYRDSLKASLVSTLTIGMWGLFSVVHSAKDFDFFDVVKHNMDRYYRYKKELAEMECE